MKKIFGTRTGSLAILCAAILALGATPVIAIHPSPAIMSRSLPATVCSSCHGLHHTARFAPDDWDALSNGRQHQR